MAEIMDGGGGGGGAGGYRTSMPDKPGGPSPSGSYHNPINIDWCMV